MMAVTPSFHIDEPQIADRLDQKKVVFIKFTAVIVIW